MLRPVNEFHKIDPTTNFTWIEVKNMYNKYFNLKTTDEDNEEVSDNSNLKIWDKMDDYSKSHIHAFNKAFNEEFKVLSQIRLGDVDYDDSWLSLNMMANLPHLPVNERSGLELIKLEFFNDIDLKWMKDNDEKKYKYIRRFK